MNAPLSPTERAAASEAIKTLDKRIAALEMAAMTCSSCGAILVCGLCGHDAHAPDDGVRRRYVGPGEVDDDSPGAPDDAPIPY